MALSHGGVLALIVIALGSSGYVLLGRSLDRAATASVLSAAQAEANRIAEAGRVTAPPDNDVPSSSAVRVAVFLRDGSIVGEGGDAPSWLRARPVSPATISVLGEKVRLVTVPAVSRGAVLANVIAGKSLEPENRLLERVRLLLGIGFAVGVAGSMTAGWFLAGRAARPVRRAYEAQANFAADASHELRTPLAFVRSGVEVLAESDPKLGNDVLREVRYLTSLTERLLTIARSDSGALLLPTEPIHLAEACRRSAGRSEQVLGVQVTTRVADDTSALADPVALEAVLDALFENVARHGGGATEVSAERSAGTVMLTLADHGRGMTKDERAHAFERFFRVDPARSREDGGAGLGLALSKALVEAQRGRIWLEDTPGGGLTVRIELVDGSPDADLQRRR